MINSEFVIKPVNLTGDDHVHQRFAYPSRDPTGRSQSASVRWIRAGVCRREGARTSPALRRHGNRQRLPASRPAR